MDTPDDDDNPKYSCEEVTEEMRRNARQTIEQLICPLFDIATVRALQSQLRMVDLVEDWEMSTLTQNAANIADYGRIVLPNLVTASYARR